MSDEQETPERAGNPLAGVLDRLLDRERGRSGDRTGTDRTETPETEVARSPTLDLPWKRRMLTIAGPGSGLGASALQSAAQWATLLGRRPGVTDLCCGEHPSAPSDRLVDAPELESCIPLARVPCELERLRREPAEVVLALLDRLRRHESDSDLSLVRIPIRERRTLMRAVFLSGALVLPVEENERQLLEAVEVARQVVESFLEIAIWPFVRSPRALERFDAAAPEEVRNRTTPFDPGRLDLTGGLERLCEPPREGYLVGLLAPEPAELSPELLQIVDLRF